MSGILISVVIYELQESVRVAINTQHFFQEIYKNDPLTCFQH